MIARLIKIAVAVSLASHVMVLPLLAHERGHDDLPVLERYQHAVELLQAGQVATARAMLVELAKLGDRAAQFELYKIAMANPENSPTKASVLLHRAAGPLSPQAQFDLAESYLRGHAVETNAAEAVFWFHEAASRGHVSAQLLLAGMLSRGDGVAVDSEQARFWLEQAAGSGSGEAAFRLGREKAGEAGRVWIEQAARAGHSGAQRYLGLQLARGGAYSTDETAALEWLTRSAESGDARAMLLVGLFHQQGRGTAVNSERAYHWLKRSQLNGESAAVAHVMALEESMALGPKVSTTTEAMAELLPDPIPLSSTEINLPANQFLGHGAAFWVNNAGYLLTNQHVVDRCTELRIPGVGIARVIAGEEHNDIAVLKVNHQPSRWASFGSTSEVEIGAAVEAWTLDHPDSEFETYRSHPGVITDLARPDLDARYFRLDARLEPGSSGAPVLSRSGSVIGMVVAKLSASAAFEVTGTAGEPVSFALHPALIRGFLDLYGIQHSQTSRDNVGAEQIVERLECWY
jgi:TPR repeat protein